MKLSLTLHNKTYSVESDESFDGTNVTELAEQFKGLLVNAGFHPSNVDEVFNTEYQWFTEEERHDNLQGHLSNYQKTKKRIEEWQQDLYRQDDDDIFEK
jgi:Tat protein secretion system quality control protein TatD with DNase activity